MTTRPLVMSAATVIAFASSASLVSARDRIVFLASDYPAAQRESLKREMAEIVAATKPGDLLLVRRASDHGQIAEIGIPDEPAYHHRARRIPLLQRKLKQIVQHLDEATSAPEPAGVASQIGIPASLDALRYRTGSPVDVMYVGSPVYDEPKSQSFSMRHAYPSFGHLRLSRTESPFGLAERRDALKDAIVHVCSTEKNYVSDGHKVRVEQFYTGYVTGAGGRLGTFTDDLAQCRQRFLSASTDGAPQPPAAGAEDAQARMISVDVAMAVAAPAAAVPSDLDRKLADLGLPAADAKTLRVPIMAGKVQFADLQVWDNQVEDGDVVGVKAAGLIIPVLLRHHPVRMSLPVADGKLSLVGIKDGAGGGITVGLQADGGEPRLLRLAPGEAFDVPLSAR